MFPDLANEINLESQELSEEEIAESMIEALTDLSELEELGEAPSMEIQAEEIAEVFLDTPELKFENWEKLSVDERLDALKELENYVAAAEHRPALDVIGEPMEDGLYGYFRFADKAIHMNSNLLENSDYETYVEAMDTFFHEGRHAYQDYSILADITASESEGLIKPAEQNSVLLEAWRKNYDESFGYKDAETYGFEEYYLQPVEVDARAFSEAVLDKIGLR